MTVNYKPDCVDSCILIAEIEGKKYSFNVSLPEIENSIKTVKEVFDKDCTRIYISGFNLVSKNTNLSQEELINRIRNTRKIYHQEDEKVLIKK